MKKIIRDFVLLFVLCFLYMTFSKTTNVSAVEGLIISLGSAAIFSLLISMIRNLNEEDLNRAQLPHGTLPCEKYPRNQRQIISEFLNN